MVKTNWKTEHLALKGRMLYDLPLRLGIHMVLTLPPVKHRRFI
jgi:hypothetical protein